MNQLRREYIVARACCNVNYVICFIFLAPYFFSLFLLLFFVFVVTQPAEYVCYVEAKILYGGIPLSTFAK